ncbi:MAG TPA: asparagine synthase (glutamine-hydrolyzing) [Casimicrobiaceae bacterium]|nr:asparagine synthase (glutamine-hydrolyzing) [Casimicrobiaceae bacterium]
MCGIVGCYSLEGAIRDVDPLREATNRLLHRGPDDGAWWCDGRFFLGHRRLSIIDLAQGAQPMASRDGRFVVAFNGEIYNFVELRAELEGQGARFDTHSDTEVILHGYRAWGPDVARRLVGMFALAIVDRVAKTLYLARDRFGEKPLFVHESPSKIVFASELGALSSMPGIERAVDPEALGAYLCLNYVPGDRSLLVGIRRLMPATWRLYSHGRVREERYWSPPARLDERIDGDEALRELSRRLDEAIRIALRSDVPVALFLSGGIDSSVIAESAVRQGKLRHAYCLDFDEAGFGEWDNASLVATRLGVELRRVVLSSSALEDFVAVVEHADDPLADSSALAVWTLAREVARDYKVAISGDGGDELFGGYLTYQATMYQSLLCAHVPSLIRRGMRAVASRLPASPGKVTTSYKLARFLRAADLPAGEAHFAWNGSFLPDRAAALLRDGDARAAARRALHELAQRHELTKTPSLGELQRADIGDYLPNDILVKVDRMTMAHGLEVRAPFLVPGVAEYALRLPDRFKLTRGGPPKRILRQMARAFYGVRISRAKKQGFSIPVHQWLRGPARGLVEDLLSAPSLATVGVLDADEVDRVKQSHMQGRAQCGFELWGLMVLIAWHRARVTSTTLPVRRELRRIAVPSTGNGQPDALAATV